MWQKELERSLSNNKHILFAGIGNVLRSDDGIGVYIVNGIRESGKVSKIVVEVSLENYISKINRLAPDCLILVDCIDFRESPGYISMLQIHKAFDPVMHSHHITLEKLAEFFTMEVYVLGIQPFNLRVGELHSVAVSASADLLIHAINSLILAHDSIPCSA
jgi:hydrogenase 3 maturation protease